MQAMTTPSVTTTALAGESGAIQAANTAPEAPFDALMALIAPAAPVSGDAADSAAPGLQPLSTDAVSALPVGAASPPTAPSSEMPGQSGSSFLPPPAVFPAMVNAGDAAENDLAALLAASAVAGRGVTARAPVAPPPIVLQTLSTQPAGLAPLTDALPAVPSVAPEDFIGPIKPPQAVASVPVVNGMPADFIGPVLPPGHKAAAMGHEAVPADFIGPVLPVARRQEPAVVGPEQPDVPPVGQVAASADVAPVDGPVDFPVPVSVPAQSAADRLEAVEPAASLAEASKSATTQLLETEALLQPKGESVEDKQPIHLAMASLPRTAHQQDLMLSGAAFVAAGAMASVQDDAFHAERAPQPIDLAKPAIVAARSVTVVQNPRLVHENSSSAAMAADSRNEIDEALAIAGLDPVLSSVMPSVEPSDTAPDPALQADAPEIGVTVVPAMPLNAAGTMPSFSSKTHDETAESGREQSAGRPVPPQAVPQQVAVVAARDGALLRALAAHSSEKQADPQRPKSEIRTVDKSARGLSLSQVADALPVDQAMETAPADTRAEPARARTPLDSLDRDAGLRVHAERSALSSATDSAIDTHIASMVRSISIVPGGADAQTATLAQSASPMPTPVNAAENATRDAPVISSVAADGRRDTQRDAETRERQIKQQVLVALRAGTPEVRMQLYPPGLGQVMIRLALDGQKLRLSMKADSAEAADALTLAEGGLRDALSRDGFSLAGFDVHDDEQRGRNRRDTTQTPSPVSNHGAGEGDAFSVDMTA